VNKSESISALAKSLAIAQSKIKNTPASKENSHFKSHYTPLDDLLEMARSVLPENGLSVLQSVSGSSDNISVVTMIMHESGEWIESDPLTMKTEKNTPQGQGSAITYGRRYSLSAILGIATDPDDDGNEAEKQKSQKQAAPKQQTPPTNDQASAIKDVFLASEDDQISSADKKSLLLLIADETGKAADLTKKATLTAIVKKYGYEQLADIKNKDFQRIYAEFESTNMPEVLQ